MIVEAKTRGLCLNFIIIGWRWEKDSLAAKDMTEIINIHNANNNQAWNEILMWEAVSNK